MGQPAKNRPFVFACNSCNEYVTYLHDKEGNPTQLREINDILIYSQTEPQNHTWDPVSDKRISQLDTRVQQPARSFINAVEKRLGVHLRIVQGYRSIKEQNDLYAQGRTKPGNRVTNAKGGQSYHNYGLAIDVVIMENGQPNWNKPINPEIAELGIERGFDWGGNWKSFKDYPHFQMTFGQSLSDLRKR